MSRKTYDLPANELLDLYHHSMSHCAQTVLDNVGGGDDSQDYIDSALEIMTQLHTAYVSDDNSDNWVVLRDAFRSLVDDQDPYSTLASDAVPNEWDAFIEEGE
jgi:2-C-methyl-D-erythritol 4-phosphate cytidylyltransferase